MGSGWVIEMHDDESGLCDLYEDGRIVLSDISSVEDAEQEILSYLSRDQMRRGTPYTLIEPDGYQLDRIVG